MFQLAVTKKIPASVDLRISKNELHCKKGLKSQNIYSLCTQKKWDTKFLFIPTDFNPQQYNIFVIIFNYRVANSSLINQLSAPIVPRLCQSKEGNYITYIPNYRVTAN